MGAARPLLVLHTDPCTPPMEVALEYECQSMQVFSIYLPIVYRGGTLPWAFTYAGDPPLLSPAASAF